MATLRELMQRTLFDQGYTNVTQAAFRANPVIMVSSRGDMEHVKAAIGLGANNFIVKPFSPESAKAKLDKL